MQEVAPEQRWSYHFDEVDRDAQLKQALDSLESENDQLKKLVVRLSETIIRIAVADKSNPNSVFLISNFEQYRPANQAPEEQAVCIAERPHSAISRLGVLR